MKTVLELEDLANKAVKAALAQEWQTAINLNQEILAETPDSIESNNRLARAYQEIGDTKQAQQYYQRVLEIDPYNTIAQKNLAKLESGSKAATNTISKELFLEEPGKTRSATIYKPNTKKLDGLTSGAELNLEVKHDQIALQTDKGTLVGYIDPELANHLIKLIQLGNTYSAHLMSTSDKPQVFLRETKQSAAASKYVSFTRTAAPGTNLSAPKSLRTSDSISRLDTEVNLEDELDNWDSDDSSSSSNDSDDFDSVSFEQMREEEDNSYTSRREDY